MVKEFYVNMVRMKDKTVYLRGTGLNMFMICTGKLSGNSS